MRPVQLSVLQEDLSAKMAKVGTRPTGRVGHCSHETAEMSGEFDLEEDEQPAGERMRRAAFPLLCVAVCIIVFAWVCWVFLR